MPFAPYTCSGATLHRREYVEIRKIWKQKVGPSASSWPDEGRANCDPRLQATGPEGPRRNVKSALIKLLHPNLSDQELVRRCDRIEAEIPPPCAREIRIRQAPTQLGPLIAIWYSPIIGADVAARRFIVNAHSGDLTRLCAPNHRGDLHLLRAEPQECRIDAKIGVVPLFVGPREIHPARALL